ncbi:unnamed protein product [Prunus armeniaca]
MEFQLQFCLRQLKFHQPFWPEQPLYTEIIVKVLTSLRQEKKLLGRYSSPKFTIWHAHTPKKADLLTKPWFSGQWGTLPFHHRSDRKTGEQFGTPSGTSQYTYSHRIRLKFMNIGSSSQNPHHDMEINQVALREGLESKESDARHSAHGSTGSRRSRTGSRRMNLIQESMVNRQFRKDREAAMARIPNPDAVVQQLDLPYGPPPGLAWPYQENPLIAQIVGMPERGEIQAGQRGGALPVQERQALIRPKSPAPGQI